MGLTRIVMNAFKSMGKQNIIDIANQLLKLDEVRNVNIKVNDINAEVVSVTIIIEGVNLDFEKIRSVLEDMGIAIHNVSEIIASKE
ncbi:DUF211 domain-containing protein [Ignisphaera sp. 4213-co]|uniref:DUF211 domain-containing protein n=1 Tax=Ignisphaera cupida TaxID=3050454 RepID=A0ABD4Z495_9CREN|nr:DUF211 domain-containing protein [Ignisphaera sp. 4213-co]MDK6027782.1 DUF211 domain-containing protein [Ignisphaera sp. 4213-co]